MHTAVLVIDVQQGLCEGPDAAHDCPGTIERINAVTHRARVAGVPVFFVHHESSAGYLEHGSPEWQLATGLQVQAGDRRIRKSTPDSFLRTGLHEALQTLGVKDLVVCGMHTEFCVDTTTRKALALGYPVILVSDAHTSAGNAAISPQQVIAHHNVTLTNISSFGPRVTAMAHDAVRFEDGHSMMPTSPQTAALLDRMQTVIRSARHDDAARIAVLATQVWLHTYATEGISADIADYTRSELTPDKYLAIQNDALAHIWVAERGAHLIGFAVLNMGVPCPTSASTLAELQTLYVQAHFLGQGVGRQLLSVAEKRAFDLAGMPLWLTVNAHNAQAIGFYMHQGFTKQGTTDFVLGDQRHENLVLIGRTPPCT